MFDNFESTNNFTGLGIRKIIFIPVIILFGSTALSATQTSDLALAERFLQRGRILYEKYLYDSLPYYYLRAKTIFLKNQRPAQAAECFLGMSDYFRLNNRPDQATATLDSADIFIRDHIGLHSESWADALSARARLLIDGLQNDQAIRLLDESLALLVELGAAPEKIARTETNLGAGYFINGDFEKARGNYIKAYETYQQIEPGPSEKKGVLLYNLGLVYQRQGKIPDWKECIKSSIANNKALYGTGSPNLARSYSSLSSFFIENGMSDSALFYLVISEDIVKSAFGEESSELASIYIQRGRIFRLVGDYDRAMEYYQQALGILQDNKNTTGYQGRSLYENMGNFYKSMGDYVSSEEVLLNLLDFEGMVHPTIMAGYYSNLADVERLLGNYTESEKYFRMVFEITGQYLSPDYHSKVYDLLGYGILLDSLGMFIRASPYFLDAVRIAEHSYGLHHLQTARVLKSTGDHFCLTGEFENALVYYQRCISSMDPDYDVTGYGHNPAVEKINNNLFYLDLLKSKALVLKELAGKATDPGEGMQKMQAVFFSYQTSIHIIDQLRNSYLSDRSKLYLSENERDTYENCVESAFHCYELSADPEYLKQAFLVAEKGKYATLISVLQREKTITLAGIPDSIVQLDASLRKDLSFFQELLLESQEDTLYDSITIQGYQAQIFQISARIDRLNRRLESEFPAYYDLLYNQQVIGLDALRKKLRPSEKLLEYFYAGRNLYRFDLSRRGLNCHKLPLGDEFEQELDLIGQYFSRNFVRDSMEISHDSFLAAAHNLYKKLIPPSRDYSRLIIIPEGKLSYFPFDILVSEPVKQFSGLYKQVPFLIKDYSIRYGYSATLLERLGKGDRIKLDKLIAFAPGYGTSSDMVATAGDFRELTIDRSSLRFLPGSIKEVEEIGKISGGRAFTGSRASEGMFKQLAGESHIIHLATHAFLDDEDPLKSKLVFCKGNTEEDGYLNVYEIYNLDLVARMVVLSACNTGAGGFHRGEGIMSLARAFIYAGVPNIIMTLWTVSDNQSYKLMLGFYRQLIAGRSTESAIRRAKLEFLEQASPTYQHPQYWAGYILVGNPDRFFLSRLFKFLIPISLIFLIGIPGFIIMRKGKVRRTS